MRKWGRRQLKAAHQLRRSGFDEHSLLALLKLGHLAVRAFEIVVVDFWMLRLMQGVFDLSRREVRKADDQLYRDAVFKILQAPRSRGEYCPSVARTGIFRCFCLVLD